MFTKEQLDSFPTITTTAQLTQILREKVDYVNLTNVAGEPALSEPKEHSPVKKDGSQSKRAGEYFINLTLPIKGEFPLSDGRIMAPSSTQMSIQFNGVHTLTAAEWAAKQAEGTPATNKTAGPARKSLAQINL
jgi:hypothetical protein